MHGLSSCASVESVLDAHFYATALLKYSQMRQHLLRFCLALTQNCSIENSLNLKQDKIVVFQGGRSMEYSRISRPTTQKNGYFTCFRRVRHWCNCLSTIGEEVFIFFADILVNYIAFHLFTTFCLLSFLSFLSCITRRILRFRQAS